MNTGLPVKQRFHAAVDEFNIIEHSMEIEGSPDSYHQRLNVLLNEFLLIKRMVHHLDLYSDNEVLEEISTSYLPYLALDYYIACTENRIHVSFLSLSEQHTQRTQSKLEQVSTTKKRFESFIEGLLLFGSILTDEECQEFSGTKLADAQTASSSDTLPTNPYARREAKIRGFKRRKQLEAYVKANSEKYQNLEAKDGATDEELREYYKEELHLFALNTIDHLHTLRLEIQLLKEQALQPLLHQEAIGSKAIDPQKLFSRVEEVPGKVKAIGELIGPKGKILQPFVITKNRTDFKKSVFGTGQTLPSMSVDEYLDYELLHGKLLSQNEHMMDDEGSATSADELEARAWDDWKDDNPKGSGNMRSNIG